MDDPIVFTYFPEGGKFPRKKSLSSVIKEEFSVDFGFEVISLSQHTKDPYEEEISLFKVGADPLSYLEEFGEFANYVFSPERLLFPSYVHCSDRLDYKILDRVLKENQGPRAKIKRTFEAGVWDLADELRKIYCPSRKI